MQKYKVSAAHAIINLYEKNEFTFVKNLKIINYHWLKTFV